MTLPGVSITELDGALGVVGGGQKALAIIGPSSQGAVDLPTPVGRVTALRTAFGVGPTVELAAHAIARYGLPILLVRSATSAPGAYVMDSDVPTDVWTEIEQDAGSTAVLTVDETPVPLDAYEVIVEVLTGGTRGTAGITYRWSIDGGRTWSPTLALGTGTAFTIAAQGEDLAVDIAAGTLTAGDRIAFRTTAPTSDATAIADAIAALLAHQGEWEIAAFATEITPTIFDAIDLRIVGAGEGGRYRWWAGSVRVRHPEETEAEYLAALSSAWASKASTSAMLCADETVVSSSVSGRAYRRPVNHVVIPRQARVSEEINLLDIDLGSLPCSLYDDGGARIAHDEDAAPGLDDLRFVTLRTWEGIAGVCVTRPRIFAAAGSDFTIAPYRRVINLAKSALRPYLIRRLGKPIRIERTTGRILERDAKAIDLGGRAILRAVLAATPKASGYDFSVSRDDDLLATKTLTFTGRIRPLGYAEFINFEISLSNPSLNVEVVNG